MPKQLSQEPLLPLHLSIFHVHDVSHRLGHFSGNNMEDNNKPR